MSTPINRWLERFSELATRYSGGSWAFGCAVGLIVVWILSGPMFGFSDTWQLVINTGTTIITFLMVFLIQRAQNKETSAIQLKLNELVAAVKGASNRLIDLEDWKEEELQELHEHYRRLSYLAKNEKDSHESLSVDHAEQRHHEKRKANRPSAA
ncbi:MAG TPA: low affinity iron permease family protein [Terriglobia bacterium]|nr:low affinity iron permease family protein [Terriglobia bacterium]